MRPLEGRSLEGRTVALLEARMGEEAAALVRKFGGTPYRVPAVREVDSTDEAGPFIDALLCGSLSVVIFLTGVGVSALLREAERRGCLEATLTALRLTTIVCRGPKPVAVLEQHRVPSHIVAAEPWTTRELLDALTPVDLEGKTVALVHYGEPNAVFAAALSARGALLEELSLYEWKLPDDVGPLQTLVRELVEGRLDAIAFTTQIQCRHLFRVAADLGLCERLAIALNNDAVVAAVGPVCADAIRVFGVMPRVVPVRPKMGPMIAALADYFHPE
ncbi:MAG: uroporphyrinogen-III synthase [Acidobacteriota bacterium]